MQHIIVDTPGIFISYDYTNQWLYVNWRGRHDQESARAGCALMLEALSQWPATKILNDNTLVTEVAAQLTGWGIAWLRAMYVAGLRYLAWVCSPQFDSRPLAQDIIKTVTGPTIAPFDDLPTAQAWLRQQKAIK